MSNREYRVLLVEDSLLDAELIVHELTQGELVPLATRVDTVADLRAALEQQWDIVIADDALPGFNAAQTLELVLGVQPDVPVIVVSGVLDEEAAVKHLRAGARDFVTKQRLSRLNAAVMRELGASAVLQGRRVAEQAAEQLAAIVASSADAIYSRNLAGELTSWNAAATKLFGFAADEAIGSTVDPTVQAHGRSAHDALCARVVEGESIPPYETQRVRKDRASIDVQISVSRIRGAGGEVVGVSTSARDVSARNQAARKLEQHDQAFKSIFDGALDAMLIADDSGAYLAANDAAGALLGLPREALIGRRIADFIGELEEHRCAAFLAAGDATGTIVLHGADGVDRVAEFSATANILPGQHLSILRDVTEANRLELQLQQAQKLEAVGQLAGGIAHDFNNLLTVISGYSDLALDALDAHGDGVRTSVEEIRRAAERAARLTQQLLAFSRRQVLLKEQIDLNEVVGEYMPMLTRVLGESLIVIVDLDAELAPVVGDRGQLGQVLINLAVNARDAMPDGGTLTLRTRQLERDEHSVLLEVVDTGTGIDDATRTHLFEPFFTTKEVGKGTGLGLATVLGIVEQTGGTVTVATELGAGSTFTVALPRAEAVPTVPRAVPDAETTGGAERVLVVEDDVSLGDMVKRMLEARGYAITVAATPLEALAAALGRSFDLVVTDVVMPQMNGRRLAERIAEGTPGVRVLFMSGYSEDELLARGVLDESLLFLPKPFTVEQLARCVRTALDAPEPALVRATA